VREVRKAEIVLTPRVRGHTDGGGVCVTSGFRLSFARARVTLSAEPAQHPAPYARL